MGLVEAAAGGQPAQTGMSSYPGFQPPPGGGGAANFSFPPPATMPPMPMMIPFAASAPVSASKPIIQACTVHPPGMPNAFDVPFPERKLPVCQRCKKNFKSRELCRQRDGHKALPWATTHVVITLTDEVLEKGEDGALRHANIPVIGEVQQIPQMCRGPGDGSMITQPICKVCKEKNYTRDYCRSTLKHTTPPYNSVYVKLIPKPLRDDSNVKMPRKRLKAETNVDGKPYAEAVPEDQKKEEEKIISDDLTVIHESKTFYAAISMRDITVKVCPVCQFVLVSDRLPYRISLTLAASVLSCYSKWCEQIIYPDPEPSQQTQAFIPYASNMPFQMWDAFRAGAMWAQSQAAAGNMPQGGQMPAFPGFAPVPAPAEAPKNEAADV